MILLITPSARAQECAAALEAAVHEPVQLASNLRQATGILREQEFTAVVMDQVLLDAEPDESEALLEHIGTAMPVHVNLAISGIERLSREVRAALCRRKREVRVARQGAEQALRSELKGAVTALLLSCEMALKVPDLPGGAESKIRAAYDLAREIRTKLALAGEESSERPEALVAQN